MNAIGKGNVPNFNFINQKGGLLKVRELFGGGFSELIDELNCELIA